MTRLQEYYIKNVIPELIKKFNYGNIHQVPKLKKVSLNCVTKDVVLHSKTLDHVIADLATISGQKPMTARAKKSIATFKVRENQPLGAFVTLRSHQMYDFLDRLVNFSLPRVKDFRGLELKSFDGAGNYNLGIKEQIIFPEIDLDKINKISGMDISFVTTAKTDAEAMTLLKELGLPFKNAKN